MDGWMDGWDGMGWDGCVYGWMDGWMMWHSKVRSQVRLGGLWSQVISDPILLEV